MAVMLVQDGLDLSAGSTSTSSETSVQIPVFKPREFNKCFDSEAYLRDFYSTCDGEPAMKVVLFFFPSLVARLPDGVSVLDVGSGPTIHVPMCLRHKASEVWVSDYASSNRQLLRRWRKGEKVFDWDNVAQFIAVMEGFPERWKTMEEETRKKVKGVLACNVHNGDLLKNRSDFDQFDVVTTVFCMEAACTSEKEYRRAFKNLCKLIKCGGILLMGGILEENVYQFGGKRVECFYLHEDVLMRCVKKAGINTEEGSYLYFNHEGIFIFMGRKIKQ